MKIVKEKTVAFTGNRSLTTTDGRSDANLENVIRTELLYIFDELYEEGKNCYLNGGAVGFDMIAAEEVLKFREKHADVRLIVAIPFHGQELLYNDHDKYRFKIIYEAADHREFITDGGYDQAAYHKRNDWMIANSSELIAYDSGKPRSGTASTVRKALIEGLEVLNMFDELRDYFTITHFAKQYLQRFPNVSSFRYAREGIIFKEEIQSNSVTFDQIATIERNDSSLCFLLNDGRKIFASLISDEHRVVSCGTTDDC